MGLFDRLLNPTWTAIRRLSEDDQFDICTAIVTSAAAVDMGTKQLVEPFERMAQTLGHDLLKRDGKCIAPFGSATRDLLVREAVVALTSCSTISENAGQALRQMNIDVFKRVFAALVYLGNAQLKSKIEKSPDAITIYSSNPDEARCQCLIRWMDHLRLSDARFVQLVNETPFANEWNTWAGHMLAGAFTGMSRLEPQMILKRAKAECASAPKGVVQFLENWAGQRATG